MGRRLFIAGCARSGTTLLLNLMPSFRNLRVAARKERHFTEFSTMELISDHVVLKRTNISYLTLPDIPPEIDLIYAIRHPFDTLTSHHPKFPHLRFYVGEKRWSGEYAALIDLRAKQPERKISYVRYCELVTSPDAVQRNLAADLGLEIDRPFSQSGVAFSAGSIAKYAKDSELRNYLWLFPHGFRQDLKQYCDEFGYELPPGYVRPPSRIGDPLRRSATWVMRRKWSLA